VTAALFAIGLAAGFGVTFIGGILYGFRKLP